MGVRVKAHFVAIELRGIVQPDGAFNPEAGHQDHKLVRVCGEHVRLRSAYSTRLAVGILCEYSLNFYDKRAFESKEIVWKIARTEEVLMNVQIHPPTPKSTLQQPQQQHLAYLLPVLLPFRSRLGGP